MLDDGHSRKAAAMWQRLKPMARDDDAAALLRFLAAEADADARIMEADQKSAFVYPSEGTRPDTADLFRY